MPEYTFECDEERSGCGYIFAKFMSISDYTDKQTCPICRKRKSVHRRFDVDVQSLNASVIKGDDEITVGQLADRNAKRMSSDEKTHLTYEHNKYKYEEPERDLPQGMSRLGTPKDRTPSTKQKKRNPPGRKKKNEG